MLTKLPQYTDGNFKVITDHAALINALQGKSAGQSACLNHWALYLVGLLPRMTILHRKGLRHDNADALSRFPTSVVEYELPPVEDGARLSALLSEEGERNLVEMNAENIPLDYKNGHDCFKWS